MSIRDSKEKYNEYMRVYHLKRYYVLKDEAIRMLGGKCVLCGSTNNLDLDHKDPSTKSFNVSSMLTYSFKRLKEEVGKCQLLCHECHNIKTLKEQGKKPAKGTHGTLSAHRYCNCLECKAAKNKYMKEWKLRRKTQDSVRLVL